MATKSTKREGRNTEARLAELEHTVALLGIKPSLDQLFARVAELEAQQVAKGGK